MPEEPGNKINPFKSEYSQLMSQLERKAQEDQELAIVLTQLRSQMKDSVVLDIGAGEGDAMPKLALDSGAREYIGVDIRPRRKSALEGTNYVNEDIETFLEKPLPPGRHVVICNGFDREVTHVNYKHLAAQLHREMKDPDIIFGFEVPTLVEELLERKDGNGKDAFRLLYQYPELNFYIIRRRPDAV